MGRAPCCDKANVKKGPWSPEEDTKLKAFIEQNGTGGNWIALPQKIGLKRCGKSCRLRWLNYLRPNIKHGGFSEEEDNIICSLYLNIGSRWSIIAGQLPGRTDNDIKNYWNTRLKKKLLGKQRKELQEARLNQEMAKREHHHNNIFFSSSPRINTNESGIFMNNNNNNLQQQQTLYFPHMNPLELPSFYSYQANEIQEPMLKNFVKIEDGLSDYNPIPSDFTFSFPDHQFMGFNTTINNDNNNNYNYVMRSSTNSPLPDNQNDHNKGNVYHQQMIEGYNGDFQIDPTIEMGFNNFMPNLDGPERDELYGRSNSGEQSSVSWDDISSLVYYPSQKL